MLADGKLNSLDTRLEQFKLHNDKGQDELKGVLRDYAQLIEDYKSLKRSTEQEANGVLINDTEAPLDKSRNSYFLVLIDGNGYLFNDELVRDKEEGGMRAARMLNDAIEKYIRESLPQFKDVRVIVRIYADLTNLSKQLAKAKLTGLEKRSLAPFSAAFTRAMHLFDFVDALDEEGTKFKIRESFKLAVEDSSCSHILYAACHDASYLSQLTPYTGARDKITLVQGADFNSEFHKFGLNVTQFPTIFRWSGLSSVTPNKTPVSSTERNGTTTKVKTPTKKSQNYHAIQNEVSWRNNNHTGFTADAGNNGFAEPADGSWGSTANDTKSGETACKYFSKGFCRFGNKCKFQHVPNHILGQDPPKPPVERTNLSNILPNLPVPGFIPLNKNDERLDIFIPPPTPESWIIYNARFHRQKPCNDYFLQGSCIKPNCPYDHTPLEPQARYCLEYVLKCSPCPRRGACRLSSCFYGHICQKEGCMGQMKGCKMKADQHHVDPHTKKMVPAEEEDIILHDDLIDVGMNAGGVGDADAIVSW